MAAREIGPGGTGGQGVGSMALTITYNGANIGNLTIPLVTMQNSNSPCKQDLVSINATTELNYAIPASAAWFAVMLPSGNTQEIDYRITSGVAGIKINKLGGLFITLDPSVTNVYLYNAGGSTVNNIQVWVG